jgi:hypothetical protein
VRIHPGHDDIFRKVIEERRRQKDDKDLYHWLKLFANSIYGCFIELNPETLPRRKAARVRLFRREALHHEQENIRETESVRATPRALMPLGQVAACMFGEIMEGWAGCMPGPIRTRAGGSAMPRWDSEACARM